MDREEIENRVKLSIEWLHKNASGSIGDLLEFQLLEYRESEKCFVFKCRTEEWMRNAYGTLHGGMSAAVLDQAMGYSVRALIPPNGVAPTVQMQQSYLRPVVPGTDLLVKIKVVSASKSLFHLYGELFGMSEPERICVTATSVYFYKHV